MRTIRIVADGNPIDVYDDADKPLDETTKELTQMMKNETVMILVGKNSSAIVRPSTISAINIIDTPVEEIPQEVQRMKETGENGEQNIDMIVDSED